MLSIKPKRELNKYLGQPFEIYLINKTRNHVHVDNIYKIFLYFYNSLQREAIDNYITELQKKYKKIIDLDTFKTAISRAVSITCGYYEFCFYGQGICIYVYNTTEDSINNMFSTHNVVHTYYDEDAAEELYDLTEEEVAEILNNETALTEYFDISPKSFDFIDTETEEDS